MIIRSVAIALEDPLEVAQELFALFLFNNKSPILAVHRWIYPAFPARLAVFGERFFAHLGRDSL